jgi:hypothetical protein
VCVLTGVGAHFTAQALADFFEYILDLLWDIHSLVRACTTSDGLDTLWCLTRCQARVVDRHLV